MAAEQSGHKHGKTPLIMLSGVLCSKMCKLTELEDLKNKVRTCWASIDQQLINKAINQCRPRLKTVVNVHGGHIEQLFT